MGNNIPTNLEVNEDLNEPWVPVPKYMNARRKIEEK